MTKQERLITQVLRLGVAGEFIGHGAFALQGKVAWISWIEDFLNVPTETATTLLSAIGIMDIVVGISVFFVPIPAILLWATFWGFWTALVRPLMGESGWDFVERWANWAAPLALLLILGLPKTLRDWFKPRG